MRQQKGNLHDRYESLVATMDIPVQRKSANPANARWFLRNAWVANRAHQNMDAARQAAIKLASIV